MKNKKRYKTNIGGIVIEFVFILVLLVILFGGAWLIATSDLPDWFKFFLLK